MQSRKTAWIILGIAALLAVAGIIFLGIAASNTSKKLCIRYSPKPDVLKGLFSILWERGSLKRSKIRGNINPKMIMYVVNGASAGKNIESASATIDK